ncbi:FAD binding domain-containing protein [Microbacterium pygmaeum]|uniref:CO or xanthine dehydrogenase, FAD-binding subunit n=1 Tax=Microbacterium pygmaeum TaxID=370764 RepID=A0A1G7UEA5_9MICO|nr:FAD binding domain-containing protein [Microbacterium pygmaeum]SDG45804.1 CO or xanthine dehydrogenase, FAD-binding subunit [Microbacterium pygmaeum]
MDITTVTSFRRAHTRDDLALAEGEAFLAGGTWLMSEPQPETTGFVDLTTMDWPSLEVSDEGLRIGATCTIAELVRFGADASARPADWAAASLFPVAANALLASFKIWNTATVGGNLCRTYAAGSMVSLCAGLDGVAVLWRPDGTELRVSVADFPTGDGTNILRRGELLRSIELPAHALRSRALLHKIALAEYGRSGAVVTGRLDGDGSTVFGVTAATLTPHVMRFPAIPGADELAAAVAAASDFYTDPQGAADWRRGVSSELAEQLRRELERVA